MTRKKANLIERARYSFENTLSAGAFGLIGWLALITFAFALTIGIIISVGAITQTDQLELNFIEAFWQTLTRMLDPGTFGDDTGWAFRLIMLVMTVSGIFIVSVLIGIVTTAFRNKIDDLRKGHSKVLEKKHTLIIRWSPKIFTIISELVIANENYQGLSVVVLGDKDRMEMEYEIKSKISDFKTTRVICRTGKPLDLTDIEKVNPHDARSIIIISPEGPNPDTHVIKSVLALTNNPNRKKEPYHIVAEIKDEANIEAANVVGQGEVTYVLSFDVVSKVTAQTCRQSGLSVVYTELLDYDGDEIYFQEEPLLFGKTFKDALFAYEDSAIFGLQYSDGTVSVNPPMDTLINQGDKVIAISEDDDTVVISDIRDYKIKPEVITNKTTTPKQVEKTLFLGWNHKGIRIIKELDNYVAPGSEILIMAEFDNIDEDIKELNSVIENQTVKFKYSNITYRSELDKNRVHTYDHIIILSYTRGMDLQEADAQTLICLLHLRNISEKYNKHLNIVSEMLDVRNQALAEVARADDFIVSDKLISLMLTQLSENKYLKYVFDDFFDAEGSEIYLKPIHDYIKAGVEMNFYTVLESAAQKGDAAIGYRISEFAYDSNEFFGIRLNPKKSEKIVFKPEDKIIVLAED
ncbi:potassium transporter TrkA [Bacteroidota bacterium]